MFEVTITIYQIKIKEICKDESENYGVKFKNVLELDIY